MLFYLILAVILRSQSNKIGVGGGIYVKYVLQYVSNDS